MVKELRAALTLFGRRRRNELESAVRQQDQHRPDAAGARRSFAFVRTASAEGFPLGWKRCIFDSTLRQN